MFYLSDYKDLNTVCITDTTDNKTDAVSLDIIRKYGSKIKVVGIENGQVVLDASKIYWFKSRGIQGNTIYYGLSGEVVYRKVDNLGNKIYDSQIANEGSSQPITDYNLWKIYGKVFRTVKSYNWLAQQYRLKEEFAQKKASLLSARNFYTNHYLGAPNILIGNDPNKKYFIYFTNSGISSHLYDTDGNIVTELYQEDLDYMASRMSSAKIYSNLINMVGRQFSQAELDKYYSMFYKKEMSGEIQSHKILFYPVGDEMLTITELVNKVADACRYYKPTDTMVGFDYFMSLVRCHSIDIAYNTVGDVFYFIDNDKCLSFNIGEPTRNSSDLARYLNSNESIFSRVTYKTYTKHKNTQILKWR